MEKNTSAAGVYSVKHAGLFRAVSVAVIISFLWQDIVFAQGGPSEIAARAKTQAAHSDSPINLNQFSVPRTLATTKEIRSFDSKETVIMIKDAHDNLGAQESIAGLLDNLVTNYEIETIAVEGSSGFVDTSILSSFPDKEIKKKVTEDLMAEGFISAAEYFSVFTESDAAVYGIDDKVLHAENMDAFKAALANAEKYGGQAGALYDALSALQDKVYSPELKILEENSVVKNNGNAGFTGRWQAIKSLGAKYGVSDAKFSGIANLLKAVELEKKCDFASTNVEREKLLEGLKAKLDKNALEELILKSLSFKLGKISAAMYYSHLVDAARLAGIDPSNYENIRKYVDYMSLYEGVDIGVIKDEVAEYEGMIKEKIFRNEEERELSSLLKKATVIKDLLDVRLTSASLNYYLANRNSFSAGEFGDFIKKEYAKYQLRLPPGLDITALFEALPPAVKFYELTLKRNDAMVNNTISRMREKGQTVAALVTGGFHAEGIAELFRKDRISYLVILPKFDKTKKRPYITIITNKEKSYKELFRKDAEHIAIRTYQNDPAFIAFCINKLLGESKEFRKGMSNQALINLIREFQESYEEKQKSIEEGNNISEDEKEANITLVKGILADKIAELHGTAAGREDKISPIISGIAEKRAGAKQKLIAAEEAATKPSLSAQSVIEGLNAAIRECNDNNVIVPLRVTRLVERLQAEAERKKAEAAAHPAEAPPLSELQTRAKELGRDIENKLDEQLLETIAAVEKAKTLGIETKDKSLSELYAEIGAKLAPLEVAKRLNVETAGKNSAQILEDIYKASKDLTLNKRVAVFAGLYDDWERAVNTWSEAKRDAGSKYELEMDAMILREAYLMYAALITQLEKNKPALFALNDYLRQRETLDKQKIINGMRIIKSAETYSTRQEQGTIAKEAHLRQDEVLKEMKSTLNNMNINGELLNMINAARSARGEGVLETLDVSQLKQADFAKKSTDGKLTLTRFGELVNKRIGKDRMDLLGLAKASHNGGKNIYETDESGEKYDGERHKDFIVRGTAAFLFCLLMEKDYGVDGQDMRNFSAEKLISGYFLEFGTGEGKTTTTALALCLKALNPEGKAVYSVETTDHLAGRNAGYETDGMAAIYDRFLGSDFADDVQKSLGIKFDSRGERGPSSCRHINNQSDEASLWNAFNTPGVTYIGMADLAFLTQRDNKAELFSTCFKDGAVKFYYGNVDEVDDVLLDQFLTDYIIAEFGKEVDAAERDFHENLARLAYSMRRGARMSGLQVRLGPGRIDKTDALAEKSVLTVDSEGKSVEFTKFGRGLIGQVYERCGRKIGGKALTSGEFEEHLRKALIVELTHEEGRDYIVAEIVDANGERELSVKLKDRNGNVNDRRLQGLGAYLDAKHAVGQEERKTKIQRDTQTKSKTGGINVVDSFDVLSGFSGTMPKYQILREFNEILGKGHKILQVPRMYERLIVNGKPIYAATLEKLYEELAKEVKRLRKSPESPAVVIIFPDGTEVEGAYKAIRDLDIPEAYIHRVLVNDDIKDAEKYGHMAGHVVIGTPLIGRGINISPENYTDGIKGLENIIETWSLADTNNNPVQCKALLKEIQELSGNLLDDLDLRRRDAEGNDSMARIEVKEALREKLNELAVLLGIELERVFTGKNKAVIEAEKALAEAEEESDKQKEAKKKLQNLTDSENLGKLEKKVSEARAAYNAAIESKRDGRAEAAALAAATEELSGLSLSPGERFLNAFQIITTQCLNGIQLYYMKTDTVRLDEQIGGRTARNKDPGSATECIVMEAPDLSDPTKKDGRGNVTALFDPGLLDTNRILTFSQRWGSFWSRRAYGVMRSDIYDAAYLLREEWIRLTSQIDELSEKSDDASKSKLNKLRREREAVERELDIFFTLAQRNLDEMDADQRIFRAPLVRIDEKQRLQREPGMKSLQESLVTPGSEEDRPVKWSKDLQTHVASPYITDSVLDYIFDSAAQKRKGLFSKAGKAFSGLRDRMTGKKAPEEKEESDGEAQKRRSGSIEELKKSLVLIFGMGNDKIDNAVKAVSPERTEFARLSDKDFNKAMDRLKKRLKEHLAGHKWSMAHLDACFSAAHSELLILERDAMSKILPRINSSNKLKYGQEYSRKLENLTQEFLDKRGYAKRIGRILYERKMAAYNAKKFEAAPTTEIPDYDAILNEANEKAPAPAEELTAWEKIKKIVSESRIGAGWKYVVEWIGRSQWRYLRDIAVEFDIGGANRYRRMAITITPALRPEVSTPLRISSEEVRVTKLETGEASPAVNIWEYDVGHHPVSEADSRIESDSDRPTVRKGEAAKDEKRKSERIEDKARKTEPPTGKDVDKMVSDAVKNAGTGIDIPRPAPLPQPSPPPVAPPPSPQPVIGVYVAIPTDDDARKRAISSVQAHASRAVPAEAKDIKAIVDGFDNGVASGRFIYTSNGVRVVHYFGRDKTVGEGDCRRAALSMLEPEKSAGAVVLVLSPAITNEQAEKYIADAAGKIQADKTVALGVNSFAVRIDEANDRKEELKIPTTIVDSADSFEAHRSRLAALERSHPSMSDDEVSRRMSTVGPDTIVGAANIVYTAPDGKTQSRKQITTSDDGDLTIEDAGAGEFDAAFISTVYLAGQRGDVSRDLVLGRFGDLGDMPAGRISVVVTEKGPALRIGEAEITENKVIERYSALPKARPIPRKSNFLARLLFNIMEPFRIFISSSFSPTLAGIVVTGVITAAVAVPLAWFGFPVIAALLVFLGVVISVTIAVKALWKAASKSGHPVLWKSVIAGSLASAGVAAVLAYFGVISIGFASSLLPHLSGIKGTGFLTAAVKYLPFVFIVYQVLKAQWTRIKGWFNGLIQLRLDRIEERKGTLSGRSGEASRDILGLTVVKDILDENERRNKAKDVLSDWMAIPPDEIGGDIIAAFLGASLSSDGDKLRDLQALIDAVSGKAEAGKDSDPVLALKFAQYALLLGRHRTTVAGKDDRVSLRRARSDLSKSAFLVLQLRDALNIKDEPSMSDMPSELLGQLSPDLISRLGKKGPDFAKEAADAARAALYEDRNIFVRIRESFSARRDETAMKARADARQVLARLAIRAKNGDEALRRIRAIRDKDVSDRLNKELAHTKDVKLGSEKDFGSRGMAALKSSGAFMLKVMPMAVFPFIVNTGGGYAEMIIANVVALKYFWIAPAVILFGITAYYVSRDIYSRILGRRDAAGLRGLADDTGKQNTVESAGESETLTGLSGRIIASSAPLAGEFTRIAVSAAALASAVLSSYALGAIVIAVTAAALGWYLRRPYTLISEAVLAYFAYPQFGPDARLLQYHMDKYASASGPADKESRLAAMSKIARNLERGINKSRLIRGREEDDKTAVGLALDRYRLLDIEKDEEKGKGKDKEKEVADRSARISKLIARAADGAFDFEIRSEAVLFALASLIIAMPPEDRPDKWEDALSKIENILDGKINKTKEEGGRPKISEWTSERLRQQILIARIREILAALKGKDAQAKVKAEKEAAERESERSLEESPGPVAGAPIEDKPKAPARKSAGERRALAELTIARERVLRSPDWAAIAEAYRELGALAGESNDNVQAARYLTLGRSALIFGGRGLGRWSWLIFRVFFMFLRLRPSKARERSVGKSLSPENAALLNEINQGLKTARIGAGDVFGRAVGSRWRGSRVKALIEELKEDVDRRETALKDKKEVNASKEDIEAALKDLDRAYNNLTRAVDILRQAAWAGGIDTAGREYLDSLIVWAKAPLDPEKDKRLKVFRDKGIKMLLDLRPKRTIRDRFRSALEAQPKGAFRDRFRSAEERYEMGREDAAAAESAERSAKGDNEKGIAAKALTAARSEFLKKCAEFASERSGDLAGITDSETLDKAATAWLMPVVKAYFETLIASGETEAGAYGEAEKFIDKIPASIGSDNAKATVKARLVRDLKPWVAERPVKAVEGPDETAEDLNKRNAAAKNSKALKFTADSIGKAAGLTAGEAAAIFSVIGRLLSDKDISDKTIGEIEKGIKEELEKSPDNLLLLRLKALIAERKFNKAFEENADGAYGGKENGALIEAYLAILNNAPEAPSPELTMEYEGLLARHVIGIGDVQKRGKEIKNILPGRGKAFIGEVFNKEMAGSVRSDELLQSLFDGALKLIGDDKDGKYSFGDIVKMLEKVLTSSVKPAVKKTLAKNFAAAVKDDFAGMDAFIQLFGRLTKDTSAADGYESAIVFAGIFVDSAPPGSLLAACGINDGDSPELKAQKENAIAAVRNIFAGILYLEPERNDPRKAVKTGKLKPPLKGKFEGYFNSFARALSDIKDRRRFEAQKKLWAAKEDEYRGHILAAQSLELDGKPEEAAKEYELAASVFSDDVEDLEKEDTIADFVKDTNSDPASVKNKLEELPEDGSEKSVFANTLVKLNDHIISCHKARQRLYTQMGKTPEASGSEADANGWLALHLQQTVAKDVGDPWQRMKDALGLMVRMNPSDAAARKRYADALAGRYIDAAKALKDRLDESSELTKKKKDIGKELKDKERLAKGQTGRLEALKRSREELEKQYVDESGAENWLFSKPAAERDGVELYGMIDQTEMESFSKLNREMAQISEKPEGDRTDAEKKRFAELEKEAALKQASLFPEFTELIALEDERARILKKEKADRTEDEKARLDELKTKIDDIIPTGLDQIRVQYGVAGAVIFLKLSLDLQALRMEVAEKRLNKARSEAEKLKRELSGLDDKIKELDRKADEDEKVMGGRIKLLDKDPSGQDAAIDEVIDNYLAAIELAGDEASADAAIERLLDLGYVRESLPAIAGLVRARRSNIALTVRDLKKRRELDRRFAAIRLKIAERSVGLDGMTRAIMLKRAGMIRVGVFSFTAKELMEYLSVRLKKENRITELAQLLLALSIDKSVDPLTRIVAAEMFLDLAYEKLGLAEMKKLPTFNEFIRGILEKVVMVKDLNWLKDEPMGDDIELRVVLNNLWNELWRADELKAPGAALSDGDILDALGGLREAWKALRGRHAGTDRAVKSWHKMTSPDRRRFLAEQDKIVAADKKDEAVKSIEADEFANSDSAQLIAEADKLDKENAVNADDDEAAKIRKTQGRLKALDKYEEAIGLDPDNAGAHMKLARMHAALRHDTQAISAARKAIEVSAKKGEVNEEAYGLIITQYVAYNKPGELYEERLNFAEALKKKADEELIEGDMHGAAIHLDKARKQVELAQDISPNNARAIVLRSEIHEAQGNKDAALSAIKPMLRWLDFWKLRRMVSFKMKRRLPFGMEQVEARMRILRAGILGASDPRTALSDLKKAEKLGDKSKDTYAGIAAGYSSRYLKYVGYKIFFLRVRSDKKRALEYFDKAIAADKTDPKLYENAIDFAGKADEAEQVIRYASAARAVIIPDDIADGTKKGEAADALKKMQEKQLAAIKALSKKAIDQSLWRTLWQRAFTGSSTRAGKLSGIRQYVDQIKKDIPTLSPEEKGGIDKLAEELLKSLNGILKWNMRKAQLAKPMRIISLGAAAAGILVSVLVSSVIVQIIALGVPLALLVGSLIYGRKAAKRVDAARISYARGIIDYAKLIPAYSVLTELTDMLAEAKKLLAEARGKEGAPELSRDLSQIALLEGNFDEAISLDPSNAAAYFKRGIKRQEEDETKVEAVEDLEAAIRAGLEDEDALTAHDKLIELYNSDIAGIKDSALARAHERAKNELDRKRDPEVPKYYVSRETAKKEADDRNALLEAAKEAKRAEELESLIEPYGSYADNALYGRGAGLNIKHSESEVEAINEKITGIIAKTGFSYNDVIYALQRSAQDNMGEKSAAAALIRWIIANKSSDIAGNIHKARLILAALTMGEGDVKALSRDDIAAAHKLFKEVDIGNLYMVSDKIAYQLRLARLAEAGEYEPAINEGFNALGKAIVLRTDNRYDDKITGIFTALIDRLAEKKLLKAELAAEARAVIAPDIFKAFTPASQKAIIRALMLKDLNADAIGLIVEFLKPPAPAIQDKVEILKLFATQAVKMTAGQIKTLDSTGEITALKAVLVSLKKNDAAFSAASGALGQLYMAEGQVWRARMKFWQARRSPEIRAEADYRLGMKALEDKAPRRALKYFRRAENRGLKSAALYKNMATAEREMALSAVSGFRRNPGKAERLFSSASSHMDEARKIDPAQRADDEFDKERAELIIDIIKNTGGYTAGRVWRHLAGRIWRRLSRRKAIDRRISLVGRQVDRLETLYNISPDSFNIRETRGYALTIISTMRGILASLPVKDQNSQRALMARLIAFEGLLYLKMGDRDADARKDFNEALWIDEECVSALIGLRDLAIKQAPGGEDEAIESQEKASGIDASMAQPGSDKIFEMFAASADSLGKTLSERKAAAKKASVIASTTDQKIRAAGILFSLGMIDDAIKITRGLKSGMKEGDNKLTNVADKLTQFEKVKVALERTVVIGAAGKEDRERFIRENARIGAEIAGLDQRRQSLVEFKDEQEMSEISSSLEQLYRQREALLGSSEKAILEMSFMRRERETAAVSAQTAEERRQSEWNKRIEQVTGLMDRREVSITKEIVLSQEKEERLLAPLKAIGAEKAAAGYYILELASAALARGQLVSAKFLTEKAKELLDLDFPEVAALEAELEARAETTGSLQEEYRKKAENAGNPVEARVRDYERLCASYEESYRQEASETVKDEAPSARRIRVETAEKKRDKDVAAALQQLFDMFMSDKIDSAAFEKVFALSPGIFDQLFKHLKSGKRNEDIYKLAVKVLKTIEYAKGPGKLSELCVSELRNVIELAREKKAVGEDLKKQMIDDTVLSEKLRDIIRSTSSVACAGDITAIFFLSDGAHSAVLSAILARLRESTLFTRKFTPQFIAQLSSAFIASLDNKFLTGIPDAERDGIFANMNNILGPIFTEAEKVDSEFAVSMRLGVAIGSLLVNNYRGAVSHLVKCLNGPDRVKAQRLLVHTYKHMNDREGAIHILASMYDESKADEATHDARRELGIDIDEKVSVNKLMLPAVIWRPIAETAGFFVIPLYMAAASGWIDSEPSLQAIKITIMLISGIIYMALHIRKGAATSMAVFALTLPLSLMMDVKSGWFIAAALSAHMLLNITAFIVNKIAGRRLMPYGTVSLDTASPSPEKRRAEPPEPPKAAMPVNTLIGIVVTNDDEAASVGKMQEPGIGFVALSADSAEDFRNKSEPGVARILFDLSVLRASDYDKIMRTARAESIRAFILTYSYVVARNKDNISQLSHDSLKEILDMIARSLPQARSRDLDNILTDISKEGAPRQAAITDIDANTGKWVKEYTDAIVSKDINEINKKQAELIDRIAEESPAKIREVLAYHQAIATAQYWEDRNSPSEFMAAVTAEIDKSRRLKPTDVCVAAFAEAMLMMDEKAMDDVKKFVSRAAAEGSHVKVVVFGSTAASSIEARIPGIKYVQIKENELPATRIVSEIPDAAAISMFIIKDPGAGLSEMIYKDMAANKDKAPSYILMDKGMFGDMLKGKSFDKIFQINIVNLLRAVTTNKPGFMIMGGFNEGEFAEIRKWLSEIGGFFRKLDISKAISEIFNAIKQTSISA